MFVNTTDRSYQRMFVELVMLALAVLVFMAVAARGQDISPETATGISNSTADQPLMRDYRGVQIGMPAEEVRKKLGAPADKGDTQDFFLLSDRESAQVFYDKSQKVLAISVQYTGDLSAAPTPKALLGADVPPRADGSVYRLVKYQRAGYWVSYSRTAGDAPVVTVSMRKAD